MTLILHTGGKALTYDELREVPTPDRLYTAIGYPVSRNKKAIDHATKSITTRISMYTANVEAMPDLAAKLEMSGAEHFFLRFEKMEQGFLRSGGAGRLDLLLNASHQGAIVDFDVHGRFLLIYL